MENAGIKVSTVEPYDAMAVFGSSKHHMVTGIGYIGEHVRPGFYDVIIINGVIGEPSVTVALTTHLSAFFSTLAQLGARTRFAFEMTVMWGTEGGSGVEQW